MSLSATEIVSAALVLIKQNPITDLDDTTKPNAVKAKSVWKKNVEALLVEHDWGFAGAREVLEADATAPAFGWDYRFKLPADFLKTRQVNDGKTPYEREGDWILSDADEIELKYTKTVTETGLFDALFAECLQFRLAGELGYIILENPKIMADMTSIYNMKLPRAKRIDSEDGYPNAVDAETYSSWLAAR